MPFSTAQGRTTPPEILVRGMWYSYQLDNILEKYEKTTDDAEDVLGKLAMPGTARNQVKLHDGADASVPVGVFGKQHDTVFNDDGSKTNDKAKDGESCDVFWGQFIYWGAVADSVSVTLRGAVQGAAGGFHAPLGTGIKCGISLEAFTASGTQYGLMAGLFPADII